MAQEFRKQNLYSKHYTDKTILSLKRKEAEYIISKVGEHFHQGKKVLDVGCGPAVFLGEVIKKFGVVGFGIDINPTAVRQARKNGVHATVNDIEKRWPYKDNSFDVVLAVQTIEHLINPDFFVKESRRVLRKGGKLIITTPNLANWFNRPLFLLGYQPFFLEASTEDKTLGLSFTKRLSSEREPLGHIRVMTYKALSDLLRYHNMKIVESKGGEVLYLPKFMKFFDKVFSLIPSLATDLYFIAKK